MPLIKKNSANRADRREFMKLKKFIVSLSAAISVSAMAAFSAMNAFAEETAATTTKASNNGSSGGSLLMTFLPLIIMFALLYFIAIRPQKKRDNELKEMQNSLEVGDEIVTGGGIVGIVVKTGEDTVVIETGGERHKLRIKTWAITENVTAAERMKEAKASAAAKKSESAGLSSAKLVDDTENESKDSKKKKGKKNNEE